ncbi:uncharacterized protein PAC_13483 [Phialocephala subalpina]|uniref:Uncharacterized protein n=1 Tax=Phialocephala subalpina TaxID=576137 RepID=A0A1L7XF36_9HELO|nr:uncharacterized protein PAC_13483 [Phialocephala subalpina]
MKARTLHYLLLVGLRFLEPVSSRTVYSCDGCIPKKVLETPGYGFDIAFDYLTATVKYTNGTLQALSKVSPGEEYLQVMEQFRQQHNTSARNFDHTQHQPEDVLEKSTIGILIAEITHLVDSFPQSRNISAEHLGVSMPGFFDKRASARLEESLRRLTLLPQRHLFWPSEFMAISAYESGMCGFGTATPEDQCGENGYPDRSILVFHYGKSALVVSRYIAMIGQILGLAEDYYDKSKDRQSPPENRTDSFWDSDLGGNSIPKDKAAADIYWQDVTTRIADFISLQSFIIYQSDLPFLIEQFVVSGELASMPEFQQALRDAIDRSLGQSSLDNFLHQPKDVIDPLFVAAIGAAQLAKDYMDAPKPLGCSESAECERQREVYRDSLVKNERGSMPKQEL